MKVIEIKTEEDYRYALKLVESLMDAEENTIQLQLLDMMADLVVNYENQHYPIE